MNILHVTDVYYRQAGGVPTFIQDLISATPQHSHSIITFAYDKQTPKEERVNDVDIFYAPLKSGIKPFYFSGQEGMKQRINEFKRTHHIDLVHIHMPFSGLAVASQLVSMPIIYTFHGSWGDEYAFEATGLKRMTGVYKLERLIMKRIERSTLSYAHVIVTLSDYMRHEVGQYHIEPAKGYIKIPGAINLEEFSAYSQHERNDIRSMYNISDSYLNLFVLRRLVKRVGIDVFIQSLSIIKKVRQDFHAYIGGKGPERESLETLVSELDLRSYVSFLGFISNEDRVRYFNAADVCVMPSQSLEGFGLVSLESFACGTPVVALPTGANTELVGGFDESLLSRDTTPEALADVILSAWNTLKKGRLRESSRHYAEQFSYEQFGKAYDDLYKKLTA